MAGIFHNNASTVPAQQISDKVKCMCGACRYKDIIGGYLKSPAAKEPGSNLFAKYRKAFGTRVSELLQRKIFKSPAHGCQPLIPGELPEVRFACLKICKDRVDGSRCFPAMS